MTDSRSRSCWIVFLLLAVWIAGARWNFRTEPLERDIATYAIAGREMLSGRALYSDLWDHKPPGIHLVFAGATALAGPGAPAVLLINVVFSLAVLGALMSAARCLGGDRCAMVCGLLWAMVGGNIGLQANQPNVELPMNACISIALALSLIGPTRAVSNDAMYQGLLTAAAVLLKPVAAAQFGMLAAVEVAERWAVRSKRAALDFLGRWVGWALAAVVLVMAWSVARAGLDPVMDAVVRYNLAYARGNVLSNLFGPDGVWSHLPADSIAIFAGLSVAAIAGLVVMSIPERLRILAVLAGSVVAVAAPGRFYPHYYQLLLPPLVLAAAVAISHALGFADVRRAWAISMLAIFLALGIWPLRLSPEDVSRRKYGEFLVDERRLSRQLEPYLEPGEEFWQLHVLPGLYLQTATVPASGVLYEAPLSRESPVGDRLVTRTISDLTDTQPRTLVVRRSRTEPRLIDWIAQNYREVRDETPFRGTSVWVRRDHTPTVKPENTLFAEDFEAGDLDRWVTRR